MENDFLREQYFPVDLKFISFMPKPKGADQSLFIRIRGRHTFRLFSPSNAYMGWSHNSGSSSGPGASKHLCAYGWFLFLPALPAKLAFRVGIGPRCVHALTSTPQGPYGPDTAFRSGLLVKRKGRCGLRTENGVRAIRDRRASNKRYRVIQGQCKPV